MVLCSFLPSIKQFVDKLTKLIDCCSIMASNTIKKEHLSRKLEILKQEKVNILLTKCEQYRQDWKVATQTIENQNTSVKLLYI